MGPETRQKLWKSKGAIPFFQNHFIRPYFSLGGWDLGGGGGSVPVDFPMNFYGSVENEMFSRWLFSLREEG